jgi:hypothetical protein
LAAILLTVVPVLTWILIFTVGLFVLVTGAGR